MNISQLQILLEVLETGNFSAAALQLDISQSAVSRAIANLEDELGVPLFIRGRFGAKVTPIGQKIVAHARQIIRITEKIEDEIRLQRALEQGQVRIASFRSAATHILPPLIAKFCQKFPDIEVSIIENDPNGVEQALRDGEVDIGLLPLPRSEEFETWSIAEDEYVVLLPAGVKVNQTLTWEELSSNSFIVFNYAECTSAVREHWAKWGQQLKIAYGIREDSTIVSMVAQGLGAAILPRLAALPIPKKVQVRSLPVPLKREIGAAILSNGYHCPAVFAFLDVLRGTGIFASSSLNRKAG